MLSTRTWYIPWQEIITRIEGLARHLESNKGKELRLLVLKCLQETRTLSSNLSREHKKAFNNVRNDPSTVVLPADKGNTTVVMPTTTYTEKANDGQTKHVNNKQPTRT